MGSFFQDNLFCETVFGGLQVARNALQKTQAVMGETRPELLGFLLNYCCPVKPF